MKITHIVGITFATLLAGTVATGALYTLQDLCEIEILPDKRDVKLITQCMFGGFAVTAATICLVDTILDYR